MSETIEFSGFFRLLNEIKEEKVEQDSIFEEKLSQFNNGNEAKNFLDELGQKFINIGLNKLFEYTGNKNLKEISLIEKEQWDNLAIEKEDKLPQYLANNMITYAKDNDLVKTLSNKWNVNPREINKHLRPMSQYITEGIIDFLE